MIRAPLTLSALAVLAAVSLTACQSTQDKAREVQEQGEALIAAQKPLTIPKESKDIEVTGSTLVTDEYGSAVIVQLKNDGKKDAGGVPILLDVTDAKGKTVFRNNAFGLDYALNHVPLIEAGQTVYWVNDQILANGTPKDVKVKVGEPETPVPADVPQIDVSAPKIAVDPSGIEANGTMENKSKVDQKKLVLFAVATRGGQVVAGGRGAIKKLRANANKPARYNIFFIGDPRGADVEVTAPPSVLG